MSTGATPILENFGKQMTVSLSREDICVLSGENKTGGSPPLHEDADDGPGTFKSCYGTLLSETWTEGPGPTHVAAVLPAATASSSESPEPTTAAEPNVL